MSRIGNKVIAMPQGIEFKVENNIANVKGKNGELSLNIPEGIMINVEDNMISVSRKSDEKRLRAFHGMVRALLNNMVIGVTEGFTKELILHGVGYKMDIQGKFLVLNLGYSHPIYFKIPDGIKMETTQPINNTSSIKVWGIDKEKVGLLADKIRSFRKPEPYKGKGFRYVNEHIVRKAGKTAK